MTKGSVMIVDTTSWFSPALRSLGSNLVKITVNISSEWWSCGGWKKTLRTHDCLCLSSAIVIADLIMLNWLTDVSVTARLRQLDETGSEAREVSWLLPPGRPGTKAGEGGRRRCRGYLWHCDVIVIGSTHTHHPLTILHSIYLIQD